jgi:hypothetical protein
MFTRHASVIANLSESAPRISGAFLSFPQFHFGSLFRFGAESTRKIRGSVLGAAQVHRIY